MHEWPDRCPCEIAICASSGSACVSSTDAADQATHVECWRVSVRSMLQNICLAFTCPGHCCQQCPRESTPMRAREDGSDVPHPCSLLPLCCSPYGRVCTVCVSSRRRNGTRTPTRTLSMTRTPPPVGAATCAAVRRRLPRRPALPSCTVHAALLQYMSSYLKTMQEARSQYGSDVQSMRRVLSTRSDSHGRL
ncbi:hypothetical protein OH76DRAFT_122706 [Lentinus brumalis]|uniref:Uncharacterized protein n=1 Tax=Lentinus brumalis TaxID=2498619 RepID=A0A371DJM8_9APHY|nr:hypothetical protein OH76DRAFT_122706 [Polyporus brumalis]